MNKEIERKWLMSPRLVETITNHATDQVTISQRYIHEEDEANPGVGRVRQYADKDGTVYKSEITVKAGSGLVRTELNITIDDDMASDMMLRHMDQVIIEKTRYSIPGGNDDEIIEVDVYHGDNEGLIHVEIEFFDEDTATAFRPYHWFGEEVTEDMRHTNSSLQKHPFKFWKENR